MKQIARVGMLLVGLLLGSAAQAGKVTYVYTDIQGTPVMESDAQGNITARFDYTPYGMPVQSLSGSPNGPGYTGHVNDPDTGFVYMQARYYDPVMGRFLGIDPRKSTGSLFAFNRYDYVNNSPISGIDPDGRQTARIEEGDSEEERDLASEERRRRERDAGKMGSSENCVDSDSCLVARAVGGRLLKMGITAGIKRYAPSGLTPWLGALAKGIGAAKRAEDWGMFFANTNDRTFKAAAEDLDFYESSKDWSSIPVSPTGRQYYFSLINWGRLDWKLYDSKDYSLSSNQVWDNFVHNKRGGNKDEQ